MTPIIRNKEDRERVRKWLERQASQDRKRAAARGQSWQFYEMAATQSVYLQHYLCGPTPKARKK